jgi:hypothetical protein
MWHFCVPVESLRAFMSSILRWRTGVVESVVMGSACLIEGETAIIRKPFRAPLRQFHR